jgi:chromate transporter
VNVSALALMAAVTVQLGKAALVDGYTIAVALTSLALLLPNRINPVLLIGAGGVCGVIIRSL